MSSMAPGAGGDPKQQLLERALGYLAEHGIGDISLRELAAALGTSHRMLSYHFGSKEGLFVAIVQEAENRQRRLLASSFGTEGLDVADLARRTWRQLRAPELAPLLRLFFELYVQALQGRDYAQPILAGFPDSWVEPMLPGLMALGLTESQARAETRLGIAVIRGLLLDVLATGDVAGADAAHEAYVAMLMARQAQRTGASGDTPA
ncbi:MAG TPA: TetR/AcrR family transcriptional regulator [Streptosporangiaceae bacterium]